MRLRAVVISLIMAFSGAACDRPLTAQTVSGSVRDTIGHRPIRDAIVQLVSTEPDARRARSATSDSLGRYEFADVPSGRYLIGFIHPILDSIGVPPLASPIVVDNAPLHVDLSTPDPARMRSKICGAASDSGALIVGVIRDTRHQPIGGATVSAEWLELSLSLGGKVSERTATRSATSLGNGWYFVCGAPKAGTVFVSAMWNGASTDAGALEIGDKGLVHRDLFLASGANDTAPLHGVVEGPNGAGVPGAMVAIIGGPSTRADEHGAWTIPRAPGGTHVVEMRAIGFYPVRTAVDVVDDAPAITASLLTVASVLDTVRVRAERESSRRMLGFEERRHSQNGHFFTATDIEKLHPVVTSDVFRQAPGVTVNRHSADTFLGAIPGSMENRQLTMQGLFASADRPGSATCAPSIFIDGLYMADIDAGDINSLVRPEDLAGVEVYTSQPLPAIFSFGAIDRGPKQQFCGAIAVWTKPRARKPRA
jgi:hypothetical protein